jgi:hypothetical protein
MTLQGLTFSRVKPWHATTDKFVAVMDAAYKALKDAEPARDYLGASMMGKECVREVTFQYANWPKDEDKGFSGQLYRVFDMGHDGESRMASYLRIAKFDLREKDSLGRQFGYCVADGKMQGHIDGVILSGPDVGCEWPALWENKALNDDGFRSVVATGIELAKPLYFAQVQVYMAYMQLARCLFTCINRDNGKLFAQVIDFDPAKAQALSDRGVSVVSNADPFAFPRIARESTDYRCKFCDYARSCWAKEREKPVKAPNWLTGA